MSSTSIATIAIITLVLLLGVPFGPFEATFLAWRLSGLPVQTHPRLVDRNGCSKAVSWRLNVGRQSVRKLRLLNDCDNNLLKPSHLFDSLQQSTRPFRVDRTSRKRFPVYTPLAKKGYDAALHWLDGQIIKGKSPEIQMTSADGLRQIPCLCSEIQAPYDEVYCDPTETPMSL